MKPASTKALTFRVHFHDATALDIEAPNSLIAEAKARKQRPDLYVRKIKLVREEKSRG